jgi:2-oxoglutarate ferredoxin oxidoreductase subunit alpha
MVVDLPAPVLTEGDAPLGVIAFGTTDLAMQEALESLESKPAYLRIRAYPFHEEVEAFLAEHQKVLVIEQNQQGQMAQLLRMHIPQHADRIESATYYGGLPLTTQIVREAMEQQLGVETR